MINLPLVLWFSLFMLVCGIFSFLSGDMVGSTLSCIMSIILQHSYSLTQLDKKLDSISYKLGPNCPCSR